jgi:hypothetical protein
MVSGSVRAHGGAFLAAIFAVAACSVESTGLPRPPATVAPGNATVPPASSPPSGGEAPGTVGPADLPDASPPDRPPAPVPDAAAPLPDAAPDAAPAPVSVDAAPDLAVAPPADAPPAPADLECPLDPALALCLTFTGSTDDRSSYHWPVTSNGVALRNGAAELDGSASLVVGAGAPFGRNLATLEARVNPHALGARSGVVDSNGRWGLFTLSDGGAYCVGAGTAQADGVIRAGAWSHLACVFDTDQISLYVNGRLSAHAPRGPTAIGAARGVTVGSDDPTGANFDGLVDDVRIWTEVRTPAQICAGVPGCR